MTQDDPAPDSSGDSPDAPGDEFPGERIAKVLSRAGIASRRDAERMIDEGRVQVNGVVVASPALNVGPGDRIRVDDRDIPPPEPLRIWRYHKPAGLVTSARDEAGRETIFDQMPPDLPRVMSVGRLDLNSEGLLLLTNDGGIKRRLELPSTAWLRRYRVRVHGEPGEDSLAALRAGVTVDGIAYAPMEVQFDRQQGANAWLTVGLREGRNREIRRVMEHLGLQVTRLIRVSYGPFQLGDLAPGAVEEIRPRVVRDQLGLDDDMPAIAPARGPRSTLRAEIRRAGKARVQRKPVTGTRRKLPEPEAAPEPAARPTAAAPARKPNRPAGGPKTRAGAPGHERSSHDRPARKGPPRPDRRDRPDRPRGPRPGQDRPRSEADRNDRPRKDGPRDDRPRSHGKPGSRAPGPDRREAGARGPDTRGPGAREWTPREDRFRKDRDHKGRDRKDSQRRDGPRTDRARTDRARDERPREERPRSRAPRDGKPQGSRPHSGAPTGDRRPRPPHKRDQNRDGPDKGTRRGPPRPPRGPDRKK